MCPTLQLSIVRWLLDCVPYFKGFPPNVPIRGRPEFSNEEYDMKTFSYVSAGALAAAWLAVPRRA